VELQTVISGYFNILLYPIRLRIISELSPTQEATLIEQDPIAGNSRVAASSTHAPHEP